MGSKPHIIYIPGLGDQYDGFRRLCLKFWRLWGVSAELGRVSWYEGKRLDEVAARINHLIQRAHANNRQVVLIGESAGAALALNLATNPEVAAVLTICGVTRRNTPISARLRRRAPALDEAVRRLGEVAPRQPLVSLRALSDPVVGKNYSVASGAREHVVWSPGHSMTIALCLTLYAPYVVQLVKKSFRM
jgi:pimeloyl-ACP methyl ester carboxylesterase